MEYIPILGSGDLGKQMQSFQFLITQKLICKTNKQTNKTSFEDWTVNVVNENNMH